MYWENIQGWFTFQTLYSQMVDRFSSGSMFVEIGTWKGKSALYMAEEIKKSGKDIKFYTVDVFDDDKNNDHKSLIDVDSLYEEALKNIEPLKDYITVIKESSFDFFREFSDEKIDFLFIDGCHLYECISKDLENWYPKIKKGGIISGHDFSSPDVKRAVGEFFNGEAKPFIGDCWYKVKK